jgi:hypothetical protein
MFGDVLTEFFWQDYNISTGSSSSPTNSPVTNAPDVPQPLGLLYYPIL